MNRIILCGSKCEHRHESINGPTGCCPEGHGPYLYFCQTCHEQYEADHPGCFDKARAMARSSWRRIETTKPKEDVL